GINTASAGTAGNVSMIVTSGDIFFNSTEGANTAASPSKYINAISGTGIGGNITAVIGQTVAVSGQEGILVPGTFNGNDQFSFDASSSQNNGGNINVLVVSGNITDPSAAAHPLVLNASSPQVANGGTVSINVGGNFSTQWAANTTGAINGGPI